MADTFEPENKDPRQSNVESAIQPGTSAANRKGQSGSAISGFKHHLLEGGIIIFSILAALLLDAAWDYREDREKESEYLKGLKTEFVESKRELEYDQERRDRILAATKALLELQRSPDPRVPESELPKLLFTFLDYRFYTPSHPYLDDLTSSGNLHLIRSKNLRIALLDYNQERSRLAVVEHREMAFLAEQLEPYLTDKIALDMRLHSLRRPALPEESDAFASMLKTKKLISLTALRYSRTSTSQRFSIGLAKTIEKVTQELEKAAPK